MAKVTFIDLVDSVSGKYCKKDPNGTIFQKRPTCNVVCHIHNPYTGPATAAQVAVRTKFTAAVAATNAAMADPVQSAAYLTAFKAQTKYATLRGYIFAQEYATL